MCASAWLALAEHSGNRLVGIGYDCIPVVSADLVPLAEPNRFVRYLSVVKHMKRVAGISASATGSSAASPTRCRPRACPGPTCFRMRLPTEAIGR